MKLYPLVAAERCIMLDCSLEYGHEGPHTPPAARSYKVEVIADSSGIWCSNGLRFRTEQAAREYGEGLYMRWTLVQEWRVVPCEDEPIPNSYEQPEGE